MKIVVVVMLVLVIVSLFAGLFFMQKDADKATPARMVKALTIRVALSISIFVMIVAGHYFGWIK